LLKEYQGYYPRVAEDVFVAPGSYVIGRVQIGKKSSVWFNAVLRGDIDNIVIGEETNIQDNCTVHIDEGSPASIGDRVTVGHNSVLHGCTVEDDVLIGMGSVVLNGARIGKGTILGAGSVVPPGTEIPPNSLALGSPAKKVKDLTEEAEAGRKLTYQNYLRISVLHKQEEY